MFVCFLLYRLRQLYPNSNVLLVDYKAAPANQALWFKAGVEGSRDTVLAGSVTTSFASHADNALE